MAFQAFRLRQDPDQAAEDEKNKPFRQDLAVRLTCPNCPPDRPMNIVENMSDGDLVCGNCGLVLGDRIIDTRSEWRNFASDEGGDDPSRVGAGVNSLVDDPQDLALAIGFKDGKTGAAADLGRASRSVAQRSGDKALSTAYGEIQTMCEKIQLNRQTVDVAKQLYRRVKEEKVLKGKELGAVIAACIFIACRQAKVARTVKEVVQLTGCDKRQFMDAFKVLRDKFHGTGISELRGNTALGDGTGAAPGDLTSHQIASSAEHLVIRFASNLGLPPMVQSSAKLIANRVTNLGILTGRNPNTVATACIYFAAHLFKHTSTTAKDVADLGGMAASTTINAYKMILPYTDKVIEQSWVDSGKADTALLP